jgi:hypothetical protein
MADIAGALPSAAVYRQNDAGGFGANGHTTQPSRKRQARAYARYVLGLMGPDKGGWALNEGPRIESANRVGKNIRVTVKHGLGHSLALQAWTEPNPERLRNRQQAIHRPDQRFRAGEAILGLSGRRIIRQFHAVARGQRRHQQHSAIGLFLYRPDLAADPGASYAAQLFQGIDQAPNVVPYGVDTHLPAGTMVGVFDDTDQGGVGYGMGLQTTETPIYVAPPSPSPQSITISPPLDTVVGSWIAH